MDYLRPESLDGALSALAGDPEARVIAGGQSLLPAMRLGLASPARLVDLQAIPALRGLSVDDDHLRVGAMSSHAMLSRSTLVRQRWPMLAAVAGGIADAQIREVGTIGGALANNDPAACWPAAVLACDARIHTSSRVLAADDFFSGLFTTALNPDELITAIAFPPLKTGVYLKFEQSASRFALVGVAVAVLSRGPVRVAVTGLGQGVVRWPQAESRLAGGVTPGRVDGLSMDSAWAASDIHADADYRAHLAGVLLRRALSGLGHCD